MISVWVAGVALQAPGLADWTAARAVLTGATPYVHAPLALASVTLLAANERRRASQVTRLALALAEAAVAATDIPPGDLRTVFASSNGDGATVAGILGALTSADGQVSPTQFHNSVHNAAAGYWSIAVRSAEAATCLGCHDWTAAGALLKAAAEAVAEAAPVLLCLYDMPLPAPLDRFRGVTEPFGAALVLTPAPTTTSLARLDLDYGDGPADEAPPPTALAALATGNPLGRVLPLLTALASEQPAQIQLALIDGTVAISVFPHAAAACSTTTASAA